jgi:hypothetical protein
MPIVESNLLTILERFPNHKETIKLQYIQSETFKTICDDYHKCVKAFRYWNQDETRDALQCRQEYGELLKELEQEIFQNLNKKPETQ